MRYHALYRNISAQEEIFPEYYAIWDENHKDERIFGGRGSWDDFELVAVVGIDETKVLHELIKFDRLFDFLRGEYQCDDITVMWRAQKEPNFITAVFLGK